MRIVLNFFWLGISLLMVSCGVEASPPVTQQSAQPEALTAAQDIAKSGISNDKIIIGMSAAFEGTSQGLGIELYRGSMAYIDMVNREGGVNGRQIVIKAYDDGYNPTPAIDNTIALVEQDDVFLLFDYVGTPTVTRVLPLLDRYNPQAIHLFFPFTGAQPQREPPYDQYVFNLRPSYRQETAGLVENFIKIGRTRIGVFYQIDAYGRSGWDGVKRALVRQGLDIAGEATYKRGASFLEDFRPQVEILKEAEVDAVIIIGSYQAGAGFIRDARESDWEVPIANVSFVGSENLLNLLIEASQTPNKDYTTNLINSQVVPSYGNLNLPAVLEYRQQMDNYSSPFLDNFNEAGYQPLKYSFVSFEGYLNAKLLVEILERMGDNPKREDIAKTVEDINFLDLGINTPVSFAPDKHQGLNTIYYTTVSDGQFVQFTNWEMWQK